MIREKLITFDLSALTNIIFQLYPKLVDAEWGKKYATKLAGYNPATAVLLA